MDKDNNEIAFRDSIHPQTRLMSTKSDPKFECILFLIDPDTDRVFAGLLPKCTGLISLFGGSHFAEFYEKRPVSVW